LPCDRACGAGARRDDIAAGPQGAIDLDGDALGFSPTILIFIWICHA